MYKDYKVSSSNSTINGDSAKHYDWSKLNWKPKPYREMFEFRTDMQWLSFGCNTPEVFTDGLADMYYQYLHVPYNYPNMGTIYRVRPRYEVGKMRNGKTPIRVEAIKKANGWYWRVTFNV